MRISFITLTFILAATVLKAQSSSFEWLIGSWEMLDEDVKTVETWKAESDSVLIGDALTKKGEAVIFTESLRIETSASNTEYIAILPNKTAVFRMTARDESSFVFEDPENDFPSELIYRRTDSGLQVTLQGSGRSQVLNFTKQ